MISHRGFGLHFPDNYCCWTFPHVPVAHLYVFFGKMSIQILCHFLIRFFFSYWVVWVLYIFWLLTSHQIYDLQVFSPIKWVSFHFVDGLLWCTGTFKFYLFIFTLLPLLLVSNSKCLFVCFLFIFTLLPLLLVSNSKCHHQDWCQVAYWLCFHLRYSWFQVLHSNL